MILCHEKKGYAETVAAGQTDKRWVMTNRALSIKGKPSHDQQTQSWLHGLLFCVT